MKSVLALAAVSTITVYLGLGAMPMEEKVPMLVAIGVLLMGMLRQLRKQ